MRIVQLNEDSLKDLLAGLLKRDPNNYTEYTSQVQEIVDGVKERGDEALFAYTEKFDGAKVSADNIRVTEEEIEAAMAQVPEELLAVMKTSMENIRRYHEKQKRNSWFDARPDGTILGQKMTPLDSVGVYVPGGKAAYPSSVLMNIIPAQVAGVERIVMVTPPGKDGSVNPVTLTAAHLAGATEVYRAGGALAVSALAYGTATIPRVRKVVGPQMMFVALAKEAGVVMTGAGATYPYKKDPNDSNIRIAPSYPTPEELAVAAEIFVPSVKLVSIEKLLGE